MVTARAAWEEALFSSNAPLPRREMPEDHPMRGLPRLYVDGDQVLQPWTYWALAPLDLERSWTRLPEHHEVAWLARNGRLRLALIDYSEGTVVAWRLTHGSAGYQPRPSHRPAPP